MRSLSLAIDLHTDNVSMGEPHGKKPYCRLSIEDKLSIVARSAAGEDSRLIADSFDCSHTTVLFTLKRFEECGNVTRRPNPPRKPKISAKDMTALVRAIRRKRNQPIHTQRASKQWLAKHRGVKASLSTGRLATRKAGVRSYVLQRKPMSTPASRAARIQFATRYNGISRYRLKSWVFIDEVPAARNWSTQRYVLCKKGTQLSRGRSASKKAHDAVKVNVWAAISHHGFLAYYIYEERMTGELYRTIMETELLPAIQAEYGVDAVTHIVQDNAPFHTARVASDIFDTDEWENVKLVPFPPYSPDLNIIENTWSYLNRVVGELKPKNRDELIIAIIVAIDHINTEEHTTHYFRRLFTSYPKRCQAVLREDGYPTEY